MRRIAALVTALVVVLGACGDGDATGPSSSVTASDPGVASVPSATAPDDRGPSDGPPAADFELALVGGGTFSPSAEEKPVYLVFWAEW